MLCEDQIKGGQEGRNLFERLTAIDFGTTEACRTPDATQTAPVTSMLTNRNRGLVRIHGVALLLGEGIFFWLYAEFILAYVPIVRLTREVNLLPYFLCVLIGLLVGEGQVRRMESRLT